MTVASPSKTGNVTIGSLQLESGKVLQDVSLAYERSGSLDAPVILVCHALTGNQYAVGTDDTPGWWAGLINQGSYIDTNKYQVISFNVLGGCDGSTGPLSENPETGKPYKGDFPFLTIRDMVNAQYEALQRLGITHLKAVLGGSLGGMQVMEWGILYPDMMDVIFPIAATPYLSDYAIAFNNIARVAITSDPNWNNGQYSHDSLPESGLSIARMIGMITYRTDNLFNDRFSREQTETGIGESHKEATYQIESYLNYQGKKIAQRFDPNSYLYLLRAMDSHDIGRGRGGWQQALSLIRSPIVAIGFEGDLLYPPSKLELLTNEANQRGGKADFHKVNTRFGHDGFLVEFENWGNLIQNQLNE
ncbi:homoserine O-acetyltransferase [Aquibacillus sp. 3ASR75-11]|uniref:Homoserine O-acetyltransferase n=1 Tax=Terrihalobacillus insolitus TaxID=2950438 RepID=A0A9X4AKN8_9BACI|nr:homoserine O-acetyltransferase [Terrihalobacillus insolitus]MDC3412283.1 homoserine O-acetyltransferase [Terrihalobacillus insolitus]MDC3423024.1 homoserine O-acetyltransferase [Terrihalobacillus insolitus]